MTKGSHVWQVEYRSAFAYVLARTRARARQALYRWLEDRPGILTLDDEDAYYAEATAFRLVQEGEDGVPDPDATVFEWEDGVLSWPMRSRVLTLVAPHVEFQRGLVTEAFYVYKEGWARGVVRDANGITCSSRSLTLNEDRMERGLPPLPHGDIPVRPSLGTADA